MQIEIKNKEYAKVVEKECAECDRIIAKMLEFNHLMGRIEHSAVNNSNVVYENVAVLNVTKGQAKQLQKMTNKKVNSIIREELQAQIESESMFEVLK